jgi:NADP-dependent 3-hydroxy acid dehydrogenase YdfG
MVLGHKVALITGAKRGIGKAITLALAKENVHLALCSKNPDGADKLIEEIESLNDDIKIIYEAIDVRDEAKVRAFVSQVAEEFGKIDILINNAGIAKGNMFVNSSTELYDEVFDINLKGPYLFMHCVLPHMQKNNYGHIVNIASIAGKYPLPGMSLYGASKAGLISMSETVKEEVRNNNICISIINPGAVATDIWDHIPVNYDRSKMIKPEEVADTVLFVLTNANNCTVDEITVLPRGGVFTE